MKLCIMNAYKIAALMILSWGQDFPAFLQWLGPSSKGFDLDPKFLVDLIYSSPKASQLTAIDNSFQGLAYADSLPMGQGTRTARLSLRDEGKSFDTHRYAEH